MKRSAEVRWFFKGRTPAGVKDWFCWSKLCKDETARVDRYVLLPGSNEVGAKVRDGQKFEVKARTKPPKPFALATGASVGRQDEWVKWSLDDREAAGRLAAISQDAPEWVPVAKKRWLREFRTNAAGDVQEVDVDTTTEDGCMAELCVVTVRDSEWWTLAFESFGEADRATVLERVARHFLKVLPHGVALTERDSMAYPEWLSRLTGQA